MEQAFTLHASTTGRVPHAGVRRIVRQKNYGSFFLPWFEELFRCYVEGITTSSDFKIKRSQVQGTDPKKKALKLSFSSHEQVVSTYRVSPPLARAMHMALNTR